MNDMTVAQTVFIRGWLLTIATHICDSYVHIQYHSNLLSGFPWPIIFKPDEPRKEGMLKLFSILQYWFYKE
jgi:hypothetical protein